MLLLSFPSFNQPWCAWAALVPWLVVLPRLSGRQAFGWSYLVGLIFFLGSIWWLLHLMPFGGIFAVLGWAVLCAYLALYFGAFGWLARRLPPALAPCTWVGLEFLRSHALSGLGWNLLGYSQVPSLTAIQLADLTGVWGVSWLVAAVNAALARVVLEHDRRRMLAASLIAAALMLASASYGRHRLSQFPETAPGGVRVAVVQGNIPQDEKWDEQFQGYILRQYERLTMEAVSSPAGRPDLIIWPETSVPGILGIDSVISARVQRTAAAAQRPLLVGAPMALADRQGAVHLTNSAALFGPDGDRGGTIPAADRAGSIIAGEEVLPVAGPATEGVPTAVGPSATLLGRYDKQHLVPFGEFVPGASVAPWLRDVLPSIGEFVPGRTPTVFTLDTVPAFSVLICFEDVFPELARSAVRRGARMLVTITNDAWFGPTAAAYQHAQASTLRAVELRVPMVRAANTGWSGCIDAAGRWTAAVHGDRNRELFVEGTVSCRVSAADTPTVYRRFGDWFAWVCLLLTAAALWQLRRRRSIIKPAHGNS